jgi:hypothetical protein
LEGTLLYQNGKGSRLVRLRRFPPGSIGQCMYVCMYVMYICNYLKAYIILRNEHYYGLLFGKHLSINIQCYQSPCCGVSSDSKAVSYFSVVWCIICRSYLKNQTVTEKIGSQVLLVIHS